MARPNNRLMRETPFSYHLWANGLRGVHMYLPIDNVEYCGLAINAGSADDPEELPGLAHFVEHTIFKGTATKSSTAIINRMEAVGGELNAYTTKQDTFVYSAFPAGNLKRAAELIFDLVFNSQFPDKELDKERVVIDEELESYLDTPSEQVFDDFDELIFKGLPLAHNILGTRESIARIKSGDCLKFIADNYRLENCVFFYAGTQSPSKVWKQIEGYFPGQILADPRLAARPTILPCVPFSIRWEDMDTNQTHTVMGAITDINTPRKRFSSLLLNNIVGGPGMNSLLNIGLREKRGLVYTVDSSLTTYSTSALFSVYFGCNENNLKKCSEIVRHTLFRLAEKQLSTRALNSAKRQYIGQLALSTSNFESTLLSAARATLHRGKAFSHQEIADEIEAVEPADIQSVAQTLTENGLSSLTLG